MRLLIVFIAVPLIEIGLFIQVGGIIGLWPTLLIVLITAITGTWLVRSQGAQTLANLQGSFHKHERPNRTFGPWCNDPFCWRPTSYAWVFY